MDPKFPKVALSEGLSIRDLLTTGSTLHINEVYDETDNTPDPEPHAADNKIIDFIGEPVKDFTVLAKDLTTIDPYGHVKKKIIEEGGGLPINIDCTVSIAFSGYWENCNESFDVRTIRNPLEVDLSDSGLLPGLEIAVRSMLVGEFSVFLLSHKVMYGELGIPPRIKPKAPCVFYIKLIRSILTNKSKIDFSESNIFKRVNREVLKLYSSGFTLYNSSEYSRAINLFNKGVTMLHKCRLADENEEKIQEKLLKKLYLNLAIAYNKTKQPLKACIACNELNRLNNLWNNGKALLQNAKALRMISDFNQAEKRLLRAMKLCPNSKEIEEELDLLHRTRSSFDQMKLIGQRLVSSRVGTVNDEFKQEIDLIIKNFKGNDNLCKLALPPNLTSEEMEYVRNICIRENLFCNKMPEICMDSASDVNRKSEEIHRFTLAKDQDTNSDVTGEGSLSGEDDQVMNLNDFISFPPLKNGR